MRLIFSIILLSLLPLLSTLNVAAQDKDVTLSFYKIGKRQGLLDKEQPRHILEDAQHYVWYINGKNLYKYNGEKIQSYSHKLPSLRQNAEYLAMNHLDRSHIYIISSENLIIFNIINHKTTVVNLSKKLFKGAKIVHLIIDKPNNIVTVLTEQLELVAFRISRPKNTNKALIEVLNRYRESHMDIQPSKFYATNGIVCIKYEEPNEIQVIDIQKHKRIFISEKVNRFLKSMRHYHISLVTQDTIVLMGISNGKNEQIFLPNINDSINNYYVVPHKLPIPLNFTNDKLNNGYQLLLIEGHHLILKDEVSGRNIDITKDVKKHFGNYLLLHPMLVTIDNTVWYWIGDGIAMINVERRPPFHTLLSSSSLSTDGFGNSIRSIYEHTDSHIYLSTYGIESNLDLTMSRIDRKTNAIKHYNNKNLYKLVYIQKIKGYDKDNILLLGNAGNFETYNTRAERKQDYFNIPNYNTGFYNDFHYDTATKKVTTATMVGVWVTDSIASKKLYRRVPGSEGLEAYHINALQDGRMILSTNRGIYFIRDEKIIQKINNDADALIRIPPASANHTVYEDSILWVSSNIGLIKIDLSHKTYKTYNTETGLADDFVYAGIRYQSYLWLSTNGGLSCLNTKTNTTRNFSIKDGLPSDEFNKGAYLITRDSHIYFGSVNGIVHFNPADFLERTAPIVNHRLEKVMYYDDGVWQYLDEETLSRRKFTFPVTSSFIQIVYFIPKYTNASNAHIRYRMLNTQDTNWIYEHRQTINFNKLHPGDYKIQVQFSEQKDTWSGNTDLLEVTIENHWYYSPYFIIAAILSFLGISYLVYRYRMMQINKFNKFKNNLSKDMHDEIGSTLSSISLYAQSLSMTPLTPTQSNVVDKIKAYATDTQDNISDIIWSLKSESLTLPTVILRMRDFGLSICEAKGVAFELHDDERLYLNKYTQIELSNLYLIFKEVVNNAIKHSGCSAVSSSVYMPSNARLKMDILDNGKGLDLDKVRKGNGLLNIQSRAKEMNAQLSITKAMPTGTIITITLG